MIYYTIHVTPQGDRSYGGFETDLDLSEDPDLLNRLLSLFEPSRFTLLQQKKPRGLMQEFFLAPDLFSAIIEF